MAFHNLTRSAAFSQLLVAQTITGSGAYVETSRVDLRGAEFITVLVDVGAIAAATNVDVKLCQSNASSSGTTKDITNAALTTFTDAAGGSKLYAIEIRAGQVDSANGFYWLSAKYQATNTKTVAVGIVAILIGERIAPPTSGLTQNVNLFTTN